MKIKIILITLLFNALTLLAKNSWKSQPNWLKLPENRDKIGNMHGDIAVSSNGDIYVSVGDSKAALQVYADNGKWKHNAPGAPGDLHGFVIKKEGNQEFIYGTRVGGAELLKMTLKGKIVLKISGSTIPDSFKRKGKDGKPFVRLTGADVAANGDIFITDGYSSDHIHRFNKEGKYLNSFGGKNAPYGFRTLHKLVIDTRFDPARIIGMDRANNRIVHLGLDGKFIGIVEEGLLLPACVHIHNEWAVVGELWTGYHFR